MTKAEQIANFDPNGVGQQGTLFGLPFTPDTASVVLLPVPWEVTVSYSAGTAQGPQAVLEASPQIDYHLLGLPEAWQLGIAMEEIPEEIAQQSAHLRAKTEPYIQWLEEGNSPEGASVEYQALLQEVNTASEALRARLSAQAEGYLAQNKVVGILGGDHSTPLGLMTALANRHEDFGILQLDAHADLRVAYEGFTYSHASIMTNALKLPQVSKLVQVGIRDFSEAEYEIMETNPRVQAYYGQQIRRDLLNGVSWTSYCERIAAQLPQKVYVSYDIDGLDPSLCPHTGTPVPDGLWLFETLALIEYLVQQGKQIIGFDLCEVAPGPMGDWDGNVGARVLYPLASWAAKSMQG